MEDGFISFIKGTSIVSKIREERKTALNKNPQKTKKICDLCICFVFFAAAYAVWQWLAPSDLRNLLIAAMLFMAGGALLLWRYDCRQIDPTPQMTMEITALALLNEENGQCREWVISGKNGLVIGKSGSRYDVDIDLSDCVYSTLISQEHALLNYAADGWYIEDCHSENGVAIVKSDGIRYQLTSDKPCRIQKGDILHIANTQLLVK